MNSGLLLVEQLAQHRDEDVDGVGRPSLRVAQEAAFGRAHRRVDTRGTSASCRRSDRARNFLLYHWRVMRIRARAPRLNAAARGCSQRQTVSASLCVLCVLPRRALRHGPVPAVPVRRGHVSVARRSAHRLRQRSIAALNALRGTSFDPSPNARDRSRRDPPVLFHPGHARGRVSAVAAQQPAVRSRAARRRRCPPAQRGGAVCVVGLRVRARRRAVRLQAERRRVRRWQARARSAGTAASSSPFRLHLPSKVVYHNTHGQTPRQHLRLGTAADRALCRATPLELECGWRRSRFSTARSGCSARRSWPSRWPSCWSLAGC